MDEANNPQKRGHNMERQVASIYRALGAKVEHNTSVAGNQIDVLVTEVTATGTKVVKAIECKAYSVPVGVHIVNAFAALAVLLKDKKLVDKFQMVAMSGFTSAAREAARAMGIELLEFSDLEWLVAKTPDLVIKATEDIRLQDQAAGVSRGPKRLFVVMPFSSEFNDVYVFGIRETAERLGLIAERADEIEHVETIVDIIRNKIRDSDAVIADTTSRNPNVFYEIGYADGVGKPIVFVCRDSEAIPFDVQSKNFIKYSSILDLRERLERRLGALFGMDSSR